MVYTTMGCLVRQGVFIVGDSQQKNTMQLGSLNVPSFVWSHPNYQKLDRLNPNQHPFGDCSRFNQHPNWMEHDGFTHVLPILLPTKHGDP